MRIVYGLSTQRIGNSERAARMGGLGAWRVCGSYLRRTLAAIPSETERNTSTARTPSIKNGIIFASPAACNLHASACDVPLAHSR